MHNDVNPLEKNSNCDESNPYVKMFLGQEEEESLSRKDLNPEFHRTLNKHEVIFKLSILFENS